MPTRPFTTPRETARAPRVKTGEKLVNSPAQAKREKSKLHEFRDRSEETPTPGDTNARSSIAGQG